MLIKRNIKALKCSMVLILLEEKVRAEGRIRGSHCYHVRLLFTRLHMRLCLRLFIMFRHSCGPN